MITQERLKEVLSYNPEAGDFKWLIDHKRLRVDRVAGSTNRHGYVNISIDGWPYQAHRLAFLYMTGDIPEQVDHISHSKSDNRWSNLRPANSNVNNKNKSMHKNNTSDVNGVDWSASTGKWRARISVNKKRVGLGYFDSKEDAAKARADADEKYGFHANHGHQ
jgi:hypothetical protein